MYIKDNTKHAHIDINDSCDVQQETILVVVHINLQILIGSDRGILVSLWIMNAVLHPHQCCVIVTFHMKWFTAFITVRPISRVEFASLKHNMSPWKNHKEIKYAHFQDFQKVFSIIQQTEWHTTWKNAKTVFCVS